MWNTLCMLVTQCERMCGNELNLVNSFSVMLGWVVVMGPLLLWVEPAQSKKVAVSTGVVC